MKAFLREYVTVRQIPITRILYAFGISLVGVFVLNFLPRAQRTAKCKELRQKRPETLMYFLKVVIFQVYVSCLPEIGPGTSMTFTHQPTKETEAFTI